MTRSRLAVLALLFTALVAVPAFAAESAAPAADVQAAIALPASEAPPAAENPAASCGAAEAALNAAGVPLTAVATQAAMIRCNCNQDSDCKSRCGGDDNEETTGTCFIAPLCSNFPTFTGTCICKKTGEPIDIEPVGGP
ncbi:MAG: hypothetical protein AAGM22_08915 [Acidobacteriota bacterium]